MNSESFEELQNRAAPMSGLDHVKNLEARVRVDDIIKQMKSEGKAMELSAEEESMLWAFRRFKLRMRKDGGIFSWQTRKPEGVQLVQDTAEILHPSEVA